MTTLSSNVIQNILAWEQQNVPFWWQVNEQLDEESKRYSKDKKHGGFFSSFKRPTLR